MKPTPRRRAVILASVVALALTACQSGGSYPPPGPRFGSDDGHR